MAMLLQKALIYAAGYAFSLLGGRWGARGVLESIPVTGKHYSTELLGLLEASIYATAWIMGQEVFIPVWLGLKVSHHWGKLEVQETRPIFNRWLIGTGISLVFGVAGGEFVKEAGTGNWLGAVVPVIAAATGAWLLGRHATALSAKSAKQPGAGVGDVPGPKGQ